MKVTFLTFFYLFLIASGDLHSHHNSMFFMKSFQNTSWNNTCATRKTITDAIAFLNYCYKLFKNEEINEFFKSMALIERKKKESIVFQMEIWNFGLKLLQFLNKGIRKPALNHINPCWIRKSHCSLPKSLNKSCNTHYEICTQLHARLAVE